MVKRNNPNHPSSVSLFGLLTTFLLFWIILSLTGQERRLKYGMNGAFSSIGTLSSVALLGTHSHSIDGVANATTITRHSNTNTNTNTHHNNLDTTNNSTWNNNPSSPYAYVFMAFGCDPYPNSGESQQQQQQQQQNQTHNPGYRPYIANMLAATHILRQHGSTADVVALFKFQHPDVVKALPQQDQDMLQALGIRIRYLPHDPLWARQEQKHFLVGVLNKIHILNLTEYRRVLFVDGDVLPLANLDYLLELSDHGSVGGDDGEDKEVKTTKHRLHHPFQETVVLSTARVPMNAGLFVTAPNATLYRQVHQLVHGKIIHDQITRSNFDKVNGWGHTMSAPTTNSSSTTAASSNEQQQQQQHEQLLLWQSNRDNGTLWDYHGANSDQGIFYFYPKYMQRSLTQILAHEILHFGPSAASSASNSEEDVVILHKDFITGLADSPIQRYKDRYPERFHSNSTSTTYDFEVPNCLKWINYDPVGCLPPYSDHAHFTHPIAKPWQHPAPPRPETGNGPTSAVELWWYTLYELEYLYPGLIQLDQLLVL